MVAKISNHISLSTVIFICGQRYDVNMTDLVEGYLCDFTAGILYPVSVLDILYSEKLVLGFKYLHILVTVL